MSSLRGWPLDAGLVTVLPSDSPDDRAVRDPDEQPPPGWRRIVTQNNPPSGPEYPLAQVKGRFGRVDVHVSAASNWRTQRATLRAYALTASGRSLLIAEDCAALPLYGTSGQTNGRAFSLALSGANGILITIQGGTGGAGLGRCTTTLDCAPVAGSAGQIAADLGEPLGHADRAEHLRGAASLGLDPDGRWYAISRIAAQTFRSIASALEVASLADPAPDYYELGAGSLSPLAVPGRALRNASGSVATITMRGPGSLASRTLSNVQPGEVVPCQVEYLESSTAWPIGILTKEAP